MPAPMVQRIVLAMSPMRKMAFGMVVLLGLLFALACVLLLVSDYESLSTAQIGQLAVGVIFFGCGGALILKLMSKTGGFLELQNEGLLVDCYLTQGFIRWSNLAAVDTVRVMGVKYLGLALRDVADYLTPKTATPVLTRTKDRAVTMRFARFMVAVAPPFVLDKLLPVLGYTKLPKSFTEANLLDWYRENCGFHILIQAYWLPQLSQVVAAISARARN